MNQRASLSKLGRTDGKIIREFLTQIGRKGGKARAKKYDKTTLSKCAKKGAGHLRMEVGNERLSQRANLVVQAWFSGQPIRESAKTDSRTVARETEQARRRQLESGYNRIPKRERVPLLSLVADVQSRPQFAASKSSPIWSDRGPKMGTVRRRLMRL